MARIKPINKYKTVVLGDSSVGKSSIGMRFTSNKFNSFEEPTIGASFITRALELEGNKFSFEIWDTAGQERYRSLAPMYYRNAVFAIVVYDITSYESYDNAKVWINEVMIKEFTHVIILVGNKIDLNSERKVSEEEAEKYTKENNILFIETSAKSGENIEKVFINIIKMYNTLDIKENNIENEVNLNDKPLRKKWFFGLC